MFPKLYFVRHGQTDWNAVGRLQGQTDIALNTHGKAQAAQNGKTLAAMLTGGDHVSWLCSPLGRTRETMEILRAQSQLPFEGYETDPRLMEIAFGDWEGKRVQDLEGSDDPIWKLRAKDKWNTVSPNGESYADVAERVLAVLEALRKPTVIVAHGGVGRVLQVLTAGADKAVMMETTVSQDQILIIENGTGHWT